MNPEIVVGAKVEFRSQTWIVVDVIGEALVVADAGRPAQRGDDLLYGLTSEHVSIAREPRSSAARRSG
jgi:hypothetical protein